jgi:peptidoglycan hydrolase CwlO-like protein
MLAVGFSFVGSLIITFPVCGKNKTVNDYLTESLKTAEKASEEKIKKLDLDIKHEEVLLKINALKSDIDKILSKIDNLEKKIDNLKSK